MPNRADMRRTARILVIDDDADVARAVIRVLRGYDVTTTTSASDALSRLARAERFDVILCDMMMPEMDGAAFYEQVALSFPEHAARIVFVTGGATTPATRAFLEHTTNTVVPKPVRGCDLRALVAARVRGGAA